MFRVLAIPLEHDGRDSCDDGLLRNGQSRGSMIVPTEIDRVSRIGVPRVPFNDRDERQELLRDRGN